MHNKLISIGSAARILGVSIDTLRRWDANGAFRAIRSGPRGNRYYTRADIDHFMMDAKVIARQWAEASHAHEPIRESYCQTRDVFQARLETFQSKLSRSMPIKVVSLATAIVGEIGNNSFDHNLGNWPDIAGVFFSYDLRRKNIVLADRGQGVLTTLKRVQPSLMTAGEALKVAFTETISGRYPEARGNGLKFVRSIVTDNPFRLYFQTGNAFLTLKQYDKDIIIQEAFSLIRGCFVTIEFEEQ